jgi:hypothetical protein
MEQEGERGQNATYPPFPVEARSRISKAGSRFVDVEAMVSQDGQSCFTGAFHFLLVDKSDAEKMRGRPLRDDWASFAR